MTKIAARFNYLHLKWLMTATLWILLEEIDLKSDKTGPLTVKQCYLMMESKTSYWLSYSTEFASGINKVSIYLSDVLRPQAAHYCHMVVAVGT